MENITKSKRMNRKGEAGLKSLITAILLVGLFAYAVISVGVQMAEDNKQQSKQKKTEQEKKTKEDSIRYFG